MSVQVYRLVQKKGPVLLSISQAQPGRNVSQLSDLSFAQPCIATLVSVSEVKDIRSSKRVEKSLSCENVLPGCA